MAQLVNESAQILENRPQGPALHLMRLSAPHIARTVQPGQFAHMRIPGREAHILRRPFSIYDCDGDAGTVDILYQEVGALTSHLPRLQEGAVELLGPVGNRWLDPLAAEGRECTRGLLVGGGVGAAPLHLLAKELRRREVPFDVVLGAQTRDALVCRQRYADLCGCEPSCSTDDGSYGAAGFATGVVERRLAEGCLADGAPYDYVAVCGPEPLMRIVASMAQERGVPCEVSLERRMACGVGACLSCVVDTVRGKKRSCVDGPIFLSSKVVWR